jgi:hypothetical protein
VFNFPRVLKSHKEVQPSAWPRKRPDGEQVSQSVGEAEGEPAI